MVGLHSLWRAEGRADAIVADRAGFDERGGSGNLEQVDDQVLEPDSCGVLVLASWLPPGSPLCAQGEAHIRQAFQRRTDSYTAMVWSPMEDHEKLSTARSRPA